MNVAWPYYFTNSPMYKNVNAGDIFTIHKINQQSNNVIYRGVVAVGVRQLWLNSIFHQFVSPYDYEESLARTSSHNATITPMKFYVTDSKNTSTYNVWWNYEEYTIGTDMGINSGNLLDIGLGNVQDYYSPNLPIIVYSYAKTIAIIQDGKSLYQIQTNIDTARVLYYYAKSDKNLDPNKDIRVVIQHFNPTIVEKFTLRPLPCSPDDIYCLYFLKRNGSLGCVFCRGKNREKINVERTQFTHSDDPASHVDSTIKNINERIDTYQIQNYQSWILNTGFLTKAQVYKLEDLFTSPRVWMFKDDGTQIGNVIVTDKSCEIRNHTASEAPISYIINVREAGTKKIIVP